MQATRNRVIKLEQRVNAPQLAGKLVVIKGNGSDKDVSQLLTKHNIYPANPSHTIVVLQTLFEDRSGALAKCQLPARILSITDKKS